MVSDVSTDETALTANVSLTCEAAAPHLTAEYRMIHALCAGALALIGTVGNISSIALICISRLYRRPAILLVVNLCLNNLVTTLFILPIIAINNLEEGWILGDALCVLSACLMYIVVAAQMFIIMTVTLGQYLVVVHGVSQGFLMPYRRHRLRNTVLLQGLPWAIAVLAILSPLFKIYGKFGYEPHRGYCTLLNEDGAFGYKPLYGILMVISMSVIVGYCYPRIFWVQYKAQRHMNRSMRETAGQVQARSRNLQLVWMIGAILANFIVTYLPLLIVTVVDPCLESQTAASYTALLYLGWTHAATNPIIYALMNKKINRLWRCYVCCKKWRTPYKNTSEGQQSEQSQRWKQTRSPMHSAVRNDDMEDSHDALSDKEDTTRDQKSNDNGGSPTATDNIWVRCVRAGTGLFNTMRRYKTKRTARVHPSFDTTSSTFEPSRIVKHSEIFIPELTMSKQKTRGGGEVGSRQQLETEMTRGSKSEGKRDDDEESPQTTIAIILQDELKDVQRQRCSFQGQQVTYGHM